MKRILVVEDEASIREMVALNLKLAGWDVLEAPSAERALELLHAGSPCDAALLDIMLPEEDGLQILKKLRANPATKKLPVMMLTAKDSEYDKVLGLDSGADDYVPKPFGMMELVARVRAVLRRTEPASSSTEYQVGPLYVSPERHIVKVNGQDVTLTYKEFEILCLLLENEGVVLTRSVLMDRIWGCEFERENRTLDVHIRTLRAKLGEAGSCIETVRGVGYKLEGSK